MSKKYQPGESINWHKGIWDGLPNPIFFMADKVFPKEKKNFGFARNFYIFIFKEKRVYLGYDLDDLFKAGTGIINSWTKNKALYQRTKKKILKAGKEVEKFGKIVQKSNLKEFSDRELWQAYKNLFEKYSFMIEWQAITEVLTTYLQPTIDNYLEKFDQKTKIIFTTPTWFSFLQEKQIEEIKIIRKILKNESLKKLFKNKEAPVIKNIIFQTHPSLGRDFNFLVGNFFWIENNYVSSKLLKEEFFIKEVKNFLAEIGYKQKNIPKFNLAKEIELKEIFIKKLKLPKKTKFLLEVLDFTAFIQDFRKSLLIKHIYYFDLLLKEISKRVGLKMIEIKYLSPQEIRKALFGKKDFKQIIDQRKKGFIICGTGKTKIVTSKPPTVQRYFKWITKSPSRVSILKGTPACLGSNFIGKVRVFLTAKNSYKLKRGEILVTTNTTPDYISAMKKAKAILTEKGGLTSHAAIVSRELKIPCIVGIPNITNQLKDGDLVEVDANKGIVKILK